MHRRAFLAAITGSASLAGCLSQESTAPDKQTTTPKTGAGTPTGDRRTADGITATFRVVDSHAPTDDTANATFDDTEATVTGTMDPSGCNRPAIGSVQYNTTDSVAHLLIDTESPYGPTPTVECGNASYDYRCILSVKQGPLTTIEVVHQYDGKENQSFNLVRS